jgi:hypothetical protein
LLWLQLAWWRWVQRAATSVTVTFSLNYTLFGECLGFTSSFSVCSIVPCLSKELRLFFALPCAV